MSDPVRAHVDAFLAKLRADSAFAGKVVDTNDPKDAAVRLPPYIVVYSNVPTAQSDRATSEQPNKLDFQFTVQCAGKDANQSRAWAGKVLMLLTGWRPTVEGWRPQGVTKRKISIPLQFDKTFTPELVYSVDIYDLTSRKA
jgi:hypothetical protein